MGEVEGEGGGGDGQEEQEQVGHTGGEEGRGVLGEGAVEVEEGRGAGVVVSSTSSVVVSTTSGTGVVVSAMEQ